MDSDSDANHLILGGGGDDDEETASLDDIEGSFNVNLRSVHQNDPRATELAGSGEYRENTTDEELERLGENFHPLHLREGSHDEGLTVILNANYFNAVGIRSMVPFLLNSKNLQELNLNDNVIQSDGFNLLLWALSDSPIETLSCDRCGIESIEINNDYFPKHLKSLSLYGNNVNTDGCRGLAKLLQGENSTLTILGLSNNKIDDAGVAILVDALRNNRSLESLHLRGNDGISNQGQIMLLKLVNDAASIKATLQSNHTLKSIFVKDINDEIQKHTNMATKINRMNKPETAGREKVIQTQLNSVKRAALAKLQGVDRSLYSEIDPLHLPELLSLIRRRHGRGELYAAVSSSIMTLLSTVNRKKCIQQQRKYHEAKAAEHSAIIAKHAAIIAEHSAIVAEHKAKLEELDDELGAIEAAEGGEGNNEIEHRSNKCRRK